MADVVADPHTGLVWLPNGGPTVGESYGSLLKSMTWDDVRHVRLLRVSRRVIDQPAVVLPVTGYFHYLLEVVPAILRALEVDPDAAGVVREGPLPTYVTDSIRSLGLADRLLSCDRPARFTRLLFSSFPQQSGFVHPDSVRVLKQALQPVPATQGQRLLYLGRRTATARNVPNEGDLERVLIEQGFEVIDPAGLDLQSQIDVMGQAAGVVGLHGAALANLVWAKRGTHVLELHPAPEFNDCYGRLALTCGLDYRGAILPRRRDAHLPDEAIDLAASLSAAMVAGMSHP
jgi:capsular polysaccharide biosynthesis protein